MLVQSLGEPGKSHVDILKSIPSRCLREVLLYDAVGISLPAVMFVVVPLDLGE